MDAPAIIALLLVLAVDFIIGRESAQWIQNRGEAKLTGEMQAGFRPPDYHLINHITRRLSDGTTQIDDQVFQSD